MSFGILVGQGNSGGSTPFFVTKRANPDSPGQFQAMVSSGDLLKSLQPSDNLTITGLNSWFPLIANDVIWIYIVIDSYAAQSATIQSYGLGNNGFDPTTEAWDNEGGFVQDDAGTPPSQIAANCMIAESVPDAKGNPSITQKLFSNLIMTNCFLVFEPAIFPLPSPYGRYV